MQAEIKGTVNPENTSYHSLRNPLFPLLLPKDIRSKHMELQFGLLYMGVKPGLLHYVENRGWWSLKRRVLRNMFGPKTEQRGVQKNCRVRRFIICDPTESWMDVRTVLK
jgi:hypothetical protein